MPHPFKDLEATPQMKDSQLIDVVLELCTTYKNVPYGLALMNYKDPHSEENSFKGVGIFDSGKLNNTPFILITNQGSARFYSNMINGRPAPGCFFSISEEK